MNTLRFMPRDHRIRTPFQGEFLVAKTQAWKAWAMVSNRFAVGTLHLLPGVSPSASTRWQQVKRHCENQVNHQHEHANKPR